MRRFSELEYEKIKLVKWRCVPSAGESYTLTKTRYRKTSGGQFPGTQFASRNSINFAIEITPGERPYTLNFRISGQVPEYVNSEPTVSYKDILIKTIDYSVNRHPILGGRQPVDVEIELETVVSRFFLMAHDIICGYSYLYLAMVQGYRFSGLNSIESLRNDLEAYPAAHFIK